MESLKGIPFFIRSITFAEYTWIARIDYGEGFNRKLTRNAKNDSLEWVEITSQNERIVFSPNHEVSQALQYEITRKLEEKIRVPENHQPF